MALSHTMEFLPMPYGTDEPHGGHEESNGFYHVPQFEKCIWEGKTGGSGEWFVVTHGTYKCNRRLVPCAGGFYSVPTNYEIYEWLKYFQKSIKKEDFLKRKLYDKSGTFIRSENWKEGDDKIQETLKSMKPHPLILNLPCKVPEGCTEQTPIPLSVCAVPVYDRNMKRIPADLVEKCLRSSRILSVQCDVDLSKK